VGRGRGKSKNPKKATLQQSQSQNAAAAAAAAAAATMLNPQIFTIEQDGSQLGGLSSGHHLPFGVNVFQNGLTEAVTGMAERQDASQINISEAMALPSFMYLNPNESNLFQ